MLVGEARSLSQDHLSPQKPLGPDLSQESFQNSLPRDNIRLPDAVDIRHGPAPILGRFFIAADNMAKQLGVTLKFRSDFNALARLNAEEIRRGTWYKLPDMFNPEVATNLENAFWIAGENERGEIVVTACGRVYDWEGTTLADEVRLMFFGGNEVGQVCEVTAPNAFEITGKVYYGGAIWIHPSHRRNGLSSLIAHVARAFAASRWPLDYAVGFVKREMVLKGLAATYGYSPEHIMFAVKFPVSAIGPADMAVCSLAGDEIYRDLARFAADWRRYKEVMKDARIASAS